MVNRTMTNCQGVVTHAFVLLKSYDKVDINSTNNENII